MYEYTTHRLNNITDNSYF